jgi:aspartate kinase
MIVHKFGGTSVANAQRFREVAKILKNAYWGSLEGSDNERFPVVVVSAMSGVTNRLISGARAAAAGEDGTYRKIKAELLEQHHAVVEDLLTNREERLEVGGLIEDRLHELERLYRSIAVLGEVTRRGYDAVASFGELLSARILAAALRERGARAQAIDASELIVTNDHFGDAAPLMEPTRERLIARLLPVIAGGVIPVITGYTGATQSGVITTLGRGGSDFSAAIIGAGLDANEVWIWSDVDGILTADPNIVPAARTLSELSYAEAADLASYGAEVLHPKTIRPIVANHIPLRLLNSFNPEHPGTRIVADPSPEREHLPAIISATGLSLIAVGSRDERWSPQYAALALQRLSAAGLEVPMFSQTFSEHSLNLIVHQQDQDHCLAVLCEAFGEAISSACREVGARSGKSPEEGFRMETKEQVAMVSVVGAPGWNGQAHGVVSRAFAALGSQGRRVIAVAQSAGEHAVSFCIPEEQLVDTVRGLHRELGLE